MRRLRAVAFVAAGLFLTSPASAVTVSLAWDPEAGIAGYRLYYGTDLLSDGGPAYDGTDGDQGPSPITIPVDSLADAGDPQFTLSGLASCSHEYFAVTAYDLEP